MQLVLCITSAAVCPLTTQLVIFSYIWHYYTHLICGGVIIYLYGKILWLIRGDLGHNDIQSCPFEVFVCRVKGSLGVLSLQEDKDVTDTCY